MNRLVKYAKIENWAFHGRGLCLIGTGRRNAGPRKTTRTW